MRRQYYVGIKSHFSWIPDQMIIIPIDRHHPAWFEIFITDISAVRMFNRYTLWVNSADDNLITVFWSPPPPPPHPKKGFDISDQ